MADTKTPLDADRFYHIYNHAVGSDMLFILDKNYTYFLLLFSKYLSSFVDVYAYCLMPNHFHFVIKVKSKDEINENLSKCQNIPTRVQNPRRDDIPFIISKQFSHFFNSYAQAINKQENRKGSLFNNRFKRKQINDDVYLIKLIHYIHYNPVRANLCNNIIDWRFSSYNAIVSDMTTIVLRDETIGLFGDRKNFIYCHKVPPSISGFD